MSDDQAWTTANIDAETARKADEIAAKLGPLVGGKMSRAAAIRRAVYDLHAVLFPQKNTEQAPA